MRTMRALILSLSTLAISGAVSAADRTAENKQANANSEDQVEYDDYYRALWANLSQYAKSSLAQDLFEQGSPAQPLQPADWAFHQAAFVVVSQFAAIEAGIEEQRLADAALHSEVQQPFVLGYMFGSAAAATERFGVDRHSREGNSIIIRLTQIMLGGGTVEDCVAIHNAAVADPEYEDGMGKAGDDADRFTEGGGQPFGLLPWLGPRLGLRPS